MENEDIVDPIMKYGKDVINSDIFRSGFHQRHHMKMTVADHSMDVTITALKISHALNRLHIHTDEKTIVEGALCHDLGILGRDEKFHSNHEMSVMHPILSVDETKKLIPDMDEKLEGVVRRHMWPASDITMPPNSKEGLIVMLADKYSATCEFMAIAVGRRFKAKAREELCDICIEPTSAAAAQPA